MYWTKLRLTAGTLNVDLPKVDILPTDSYTFKGAEGLGPSEIDVAISSTRHQGGVYQNREARLKQLIIRVGLQPNYASGQTVADLRTGMYALLNSEVTVFVMNGATEICRVVGYVEKCEAAMFSKDPEMQLTISCLSPYFRAPAAVAVNLGTLSKTAPVIPNIGSAPSGFYMKLTFTANIGTSWILTNSKGEFISVQGFNFLTNDELYFNTDPGSRVIWAERDSVGLAVNLLSNLTVDSDWLQLLSGNNNFTTSDARFNWNSVLYTPQYWGL